jgi:hypothetical protein
MTQQVQQQRVNAVTKNENTNECKSDASQFSLSDGEHSVLSIFRMYLMTPGKMLCFSGPDLDTHKVPLAELTNKGMLVVESFDGGYSLTDTGFAAMKNGD